jgi:hypothetical protein
MIITVATTSDFRATGLVSGPQLHFELVTNEDS